MSEGNSEDVYVTPDGSSDNAKDKAAKKKKSKKSEKKKTKGSPSTKKKQPVEQVLGIQSRSEDNSNVAKMKPPTELVLEIPPETQPAAVPVLEESPVTKPQQPVLGIQSRPESPAKKKHPPKKRSPKKRPPKKHPPRSIPRIEDDSAWEEDYNTDNLSDSIAHSYNVPRKKPQSRRRRQLTRPDSCNDERWEDLKEQFLEFSNYRLLPGGSAHKNGVIESFQDFRLIKRKRFRRDGLGGEAASTEEMDEIFDDLHGEPASTEEIVALFDDFYERKIRLEVWDGIYKGIHLNPKFVKPFAKSPGQAPKKPTLSKGDAKPPMLEEEDEDDTIYDSGPGTTVSKPKSRKNFKKKDKSDEDVEKSPKKKKKPRSKSRDKSGEEKKKKKKDKDKNASSKSLGDSKKSKKKSRDKSKKDLQ